MPPKFPKAERIELKDPPLELVVCQIRFPPVLTLAAGQPPDDFQRSVSSEYPVSKIHHKILGLLGMGESEAPQPPLTHWSFEDLESRWTLSLGSTFLSVETNNYERFDDLWKRFSSGLEIARKLYSIQIMTRLGLRYIDRITAATQPSLPADWIQSINSQLLPLRSMREDDESQRALVEVRHQFGDYAMTIRSLYVDAGFGGAPEAELVLDFDCYTDNRGTIAGLEGKLTYFKSIAYDGFRWAIGDIIECFEPS